MHPRWLTFRSLFPMLLLLPVVACGAGEKDDRSVAPQWVLDSVPDLAVGGDRTGPGHDLHLVRGAVALPDGGVAVLNAGTQEVRRFDAAGQLVATIGGPGDGPGEFRAPLALGLSGDTLMVYDGALRRLSRFDLAGALLDETPNPEAWAWPAVAMRVVTGGDLVAVDVSSPGTTRPDGTRQHSYTVWRWRVGRGVDSIGTWPGATFIMRTSAGSESAWLMPFATETQVAAASDRLFIGTSDQYRFLVLGLDGSRIGEISGPTTRRSLTEQDRAEMIDWRVSVAPSASAAETRAALEGAGLPDQLPAFGELRADALGLLWVSPYWTPGVEHLDWSVWHPDGRLMAMVELPANLRVFEIGERFVLGLREVASGAIVVERYPLDRRPLPPVR